MYLNTDKAYLLGLIVGGGTWNADETSLSIKLPFKQWGSYAVNPQTTALISQDVLKVVNPIFNTAYGLTIQYTASDGFWTLHLEGDISTLRNDMDALDLPHKGEVKRSADLKRLISALSDLNMRKRFVAGLADTIGSVSGSHRRFSDENQIISFEISGFNFKFVCDLCKLLHSIGCYPDQILWNHPNFHCSNDPYNHKWKKGFKLRVLLDQYTQTGSFAFSSKANQAKINKSKESQPKQGEPCQSKKLEITPTTVHEDEDSSLLPKLIRGGHYLHNRHVCAVLNCPNAPISEVEKAIKQAPDLIIPFPILTKGDRQDIQKIINSEEIYTQVNYFVKKVSLKEFLTTLENCRNGLFNEDPKKTGKAGYPVNKIKAGLAFLIAMETGHIKGKRPSGKMEEVITSFLKTSPNFQFELRIPNFLTPLIIFTSKAGCLIGASNPDVYAKLIKRDSQIPFKLRVDKININDLNNEK